MRVAVVGAGVSGLTCGVRLLEAGARVTMITRDPPARTTSSVAGAVWFPYRVRPNARTGPWGAASYARFAAMAGDERMPITMVELAILYPHVLEEDPWWQPSLPPESVRAPEAHELPDGYADGRAALVPCIEAPAYLDWLARRFEELGGETVVRDLEALEQAGPADAVVNCAGVGAGALTGEDDIHPVRGQVAYVRTRERLRFMVDETSSNALAYILPRPDVVVLGGTAEDGDWDMRPRPETTRSILERTLLLEPRLEHAQYLGSAVGLRPARSEVRLEAGLLADGRPVVHDYGHGGSGFTLSWGCADEVARLLLEDA